MLLMLLLLISSSRQEGIQLRGRIMEDIPLRMSIRGEALGLGSALAAVVRVRVRVLVLEGDLRDGYLVDMEVARMEEERALGMVARVGIPLAGGAVAGGVLMEEQLEEGVGRRVRLEVLMIEFSSHLYVLIRVVAVASARRRHRLRRLIRSLIVEVAVEDHRGCMQTIGRCRGVVEI